MQKWSKKRAQLSLFAALSFLLMLSSFTFHENTRRMQEASKEGSTPSFPTYFTTNASTPQTKKWVSGDLNWSTTCATFRNYSGRAISGRRVQDTWDESPPAGCDLFSGKWVYDNDSYPLYEEAGCPYMSDQLACTKHGRPDKMYQSWRWQPHNCDLKRWNATEVLEKLRDKRLMFIGDSLNRGQWIAMVCFLQPVIPAGKKSITPNAALTTFRAKEYNASVEFYWAPLLVESNSDDPVNHRLEHRIIRPDSILKHASRWQDADILVFNTYLWWRSGPKIKLLWSKEDEDCEEADGIEAMKLSLDTWADWVASNVDTQTKRLFFVTMSPTHLRSQEWKAAGNEGNCFHEDTPIDMEGYWGSGSDLATMQMVNNILGRLRRKVSVLNITQLSEYRKDGHPSIYRKFWETLSPQQLSKPKTYADCIHWCLPGVPDTWNQLLFNLL